MLYLCFILLSAFIVQETVSQGYCTRAAGIFNTTDGGAACMSSATYNVVNCCFRCGTNVTGLVRCGSLFNYGLTSCTQNATILDQVKADCFALYGNSTFQCSCNTGTNTSQLDGTPAPTNAPTNGGVKTMKTGVMSLFFIVVAMYMC